MNYHKRVLWFVSIVTIALLLSSLAIAYFNIGWKPLNNISILSDVLKKKSSLKSKTKETSVALHKGSLHKTFESFEDAHRVTAYYDDSNQVALPKLIQALTELKQGKRRKVRIAFLGDSMIEDDLISLTLRRLLQQHFGGYGVGYLPMNNTAGGGRPTANILSSNNWHEDNFRSNSSNKLLYISGRLFTNEGSAYTAVHDKTCDANKPLYKYLLYGSTQGNVVSCNNVSLKSTATFNVKLLDSAVGNEYRFNVQNALPVYGVSIEAPTGVVVDNFSFRGNSGWEFGKMDSIFLASIAELHNYDLIIMQYGINIFVKPSDEKFTWYKQPMYKSVAKIKACFKNADVLLMSCADRAFRYGSEYKTAIGMPAILDIQQQLAFENGIAFYNTFSSMGGEGSITKWVNSKPPLAYKDYMHPNDKGSEQIGQSLYEAILHEYAKPH
jgi:hypothetical protein